jgi:hypothetical protein
VSVRRILVLLVLVAALGVYLAVYELPQAEKEGKKEKLLGVDKNAVTGISLTYPDRAMEVRKDEKGWRVTKPVDAPADEGVVTSLLTTLVEAEVQKTLDELPADLAPFGLDKPSVVARVTSKDGSQSPTIAVGKNTTIGGRTYVRKGDEPKVYLTTTSLKFGLDKQVKDLRDKAVIAYQDDDVQRVAIQRAEGETTTLVRKDKDAWTVEPGDQPADPTEVRSYLSSLRSTRAVDFPDDAPADLGKYGLATPRLVVAVTTGKEGEQKTHRLLLGGETTAGTQKQVYAKREDQPTVYALGDWAFRTLAKSAAQFRDKTVLGFDPARVGRVELGRKTGEGAAFARAEGGGWKLEGAEGDAKTDAITRFLDDLRDLRGSDIAAEPVGDLGAFGLDAPDLSIKLTDKDGHPMGTVLAAKKDAKHYAMREGGQTIFEARDYMFTRLDRQRADFVAAKGEAAKPEEVAPPVEGEAEDGEEPSAEEDGE